MKFRIMVRNKNQQEVISEHESEGWIIGHEQIMEATGGNPFYERGVVFEDAGGIVQYIRITEDK